MRRRVSHNSPRDRSPPKEHCPGSEIGPKVTSVATPSRTQAIGWVWGQGTDVGPYTEAIQGRGVVLSCLDRCGSPKRGRRGGQLLRACPSSSLGRIGRPSNCQWAPGLCPRADFESEPVVPAPQALSQTQRSTSSGLRPQAPEQNGTRYSRRRLKARQPALAASGRSREWLSTQASDGGGQPV